MTTRTGFTRGYRVWFLLDALVTGVNAAAYLLLHRWLDDVLGANPTIYLVVGVVLTAFTFTLAAVACTSRPLIGLANLLVVLNTAWSIGSIVIAIVNPYGFNGWGLAWVAAQAAVVLAFTTLQATALGRQRNARLAPTPRQSLR
ncbi:hypothetical protein O4159_23770 [Gordonia terrae]|uniref:hypothetical protein n=1 Tax=Gordonia hongkongensis TaxID=1701090 RepID=UPI0022B46E5E|nr:hypothetical protein [Gordonia terrae]